MTQNPPPLSAEKATIEDVARAAGVSRWTVARAFKTNASVSSKTRAKVLGAAKEIGYLPDLQAASLGANQSNLVALLVDDFKNPHKLLLIEQVSQTLRDHGWDSLLINTGGAQDTNAALLTASQRRVDAAILLGVHFNDAVLDAAVGAERVKKLIVFARSSKHPRTLSICVDDAAAMAIVADHVLAQGYQRPLFLAGPQTGSAHLHRQETFVQQWFEATGDAPHSLEVPVYDSALSYTKISKYLAESKSYPDVIVCENDALALGAMDAIRLSAGLSVPDDIAVTGFDDVPQAGFAQYQLTTYRQPIKEMAEHLVKLLRGEAQANDRCDFSGTLVERSST
ncbi:LacI family DNA-binding transcriptional regulator [Epibacterium ulvae]|uniref:LacI family DNA-binding transcriptional regulator n=1 Tax=Epibacterium ulvae TaxID=1156985 RepID=UPI0024905DBA|nr:LacI family DNA-binding transcriptional regulator [Epibacterium ulvae]